MEQGPGAPVPLPGHAPGGGQEHPQEHQGHAVLVEQPDVPALYRAGDLPPGLGVQGEDVLVAADAVGVPLLLGLRQEVLPGPEHPLELLLQPLVAAQQVLVGEDGVPVTVLGKIPGDRPSSPGWGAEPRPPRR